MIFDVRSLRVIIHERINYNLYYPSMKDVFCYFGIAKTTQPGFYGLYCRLDAGGQGSHFLRDF